MLAIPPNEVQAGRAGLIGTLLLSTLAVAMRIYTKAQFMHKIEAPDYSILLGWGLFVGCFSLAWLAHDIAHGVHQWDSELGKLELETLSLFFYYFHVDKILYDICIFFVKLSILLQYLQIFVPLKSRTKMYWCLHLLIWLNFTFYLTVTFITIFACSPINMVWDLSITHGHCIDLISIDIATGAINALSDIAILVLPQVKIWKLQMKLRRKVQISVIFLVGSFACVCSILRLSFDVRSQLSTDKVYGCWRAVAWIFPEMAFGIVVACAPVSAKFFQGMKETKAFLKARSSLSMLFSLFPSTSRGASSGNSAKDHIAMDGPALPTSALKPGQNKKFYNSSRRESNSSKSNPLTTVFGEDTPYQPGTYIMRTVNIETRFDSKNCRPSHSTEGEQNLWEAEGSHCTEVGV